MRRYGVRGWGLVLDGVLDKVLDKVLDVVVA